MECSFFKGTLNYEMLLFIRAHGLSIEHALACTWSMSNMWVTDPFFAGLPPPSNKFDMPLRFSGKEDAHEACLWFRSRTVSPEE